MPNPQHLPPITCLCPTYGRFERLRDAVACFLLQDYPGEATLLILNDANDPIVISERLTVAADQYLVAGRIRVINSPHRYANLGAKRQTLLEHTGALGAPTVAHWDDDDLYLPWHLSAAVEALCGPAPAPECRPEPATGRAKDLAVADMAQRLPAEAGPPAVSCSKSRSAWWALGRRECWELQGGVHHNTFEGQMVFRRDRALELGGYPPKMSGQAAALLRAFERAGELKLYRPADEDVSYIYRWADGAGHVSACPGSGARRQMEWLKRNQDFGLGRDGNPTPLIPSGNPILWARARLARQFRILLEQLKPRLEPEAWQKARTRIAEAMGWEGRPQAGAEPSVLPAGLHEQPDQGELLVSSQSQARSCPPVCARLLQGRPEAHQTPVRRGAAPGRAPRGGHA